jgi:hypothetical protein
MSPIRFALDTLRMANRSSTPASNINDSLGLLDDIWGVWLGPPFPADLGDFLGSRPELKIYICHCFQKPAT